jgi:hypothetical protein
MATLSKPSALLRSVSRNASATHLDVTSGSRQLASTKWTTSVKLRSSKLVTRSEWLEMAHVEETGSSEDCSSKEPFHLRYILLM